LKLPQQGVAADALAGGLGVRDERIHRREVELALLRLHDVPLARVLGSDGGERRREDLSIAGVFPRRSDVDGGAERPRVRVRCGRALAQSRLDGNDQIGWVGGAAAGNEDGCDQRGGGSTHRPASMSRDPHPPLWLGAERRRADLA
jgi:hypothetical protein